MSDYIITKGFFSSTSSMLKKQFSTHFHTLLKIIVLVVIFEFSTVQLQAKEIMIASAAGLTLREVPKIRTRSALGGLFHN